MPAALHFCAKTPVFPVGRDPLPSSLRKKEGIVNCRDGGNSPTGTCWEMKRCNYEKEKKRFKQRINRTELCMRKESSTESTFPQISPQLYQEHLRKALQTTWGCAALIQHIINI